MGALMMNFLSNKLRQFRDCESGAVTVDFVVITAGIVLLGFIVVNTFDEEVVVIANGIETQMDNVGDTLPN